MGSVCLSILMARSEPLGWIRDVKRVEEMDLRFLLMGGGGAGGVSGGWWGTGVRDGGERVGGCGCGMVFGGGSVGLMGVAAHAVLAAGGEVVGAIPDVIVDREIGHSGVTELRVVRTMHQRKAAMADSADAFIPLPGGFGTMDEF